MTIYNIFEFPTATSDTSKVTEKEIRQWWDHVYFHSSTHFINILILNSEFYKLGIKDSLKTVQMDSSQNR
jgi:hypothetical protein